MHVKISKTFGIILLSPLFLAGIAKAQVALTVGADEYYDDNVFLEDDNGAPAPVITDNQLTQPGANFKAPEQFNGDPDTDFITNVFISGSSDVSFSPNWKTGVAAKVGGLFFADHSDEDRLTLDSLVSFSPEQTLLPAPWTFSLVDQIQSRGDSVGSADGTASKQTQYHQVGLTLGASEVRLADRTSASAAYGFTYSQFLGDFTFKDKDEEELGPYANQADSNGNDYISNGIDGSVNQSISRSLVAGLFAGINSLNYTKVDNLGSDPDFDKSDLDRTEARAGTRANYQVNEKLSLNGQVGIQLSELQNDPKERTVTITDSDGTTSVVDATPDKDSTNLIFAGGIRFFPVPSLSTAVTVDQTSGNDVNGNRITSRSVNLDVIKSFGDRLKAGATGRFIQFSSGDELTAATDRYEGSLFVGYNIFQNVALHGGWNFGVQKVDDDISNLQAASQGTQDYEFNRFFVGISTGIIGN